MQDLAFSFDAGHLALGVLTALTLGSLVHVRMVAVLLAVGIAGILFYALLWNGERPVELYEEAARRLSEAAGSGFLFGFSIASGASTIFRGLIRTAARNKTRMRR